MRSFHIPRTLGVQALRKQLNVLRCLEKERSANTARPISTQTRTSHFSCTSCTCTGMLRWVESSHTLQRAFSLVLQSLGMFHASCFVLLPYSSSQWIRSCTGHSSSKGTMLSMPRRQVLWDSGARVSTALSCLAYLPTSQVEKPHLCISVSLLDICLASMTSLLSGPSGRKLIIFISLFQSSLSA